MRHAELATAAVSALLTLILLFPAPPALANCVADSGAVGDIEGPDVTVICDSSEPNPFTTGIGSVNTADNLTVIIEADASVTSTTVGVRLADDGTLTNDGSVLASDQVVLAETTLNTERITIGNSGNLTSTNGAAVETGAGNADITNTGSIQGVSAGIIMTGSELTNSGDIAALADDATTVDAGIDSTVTNSGTITSSGIGINLGANAILEHSGTLTSTGVGVVAGSAADVDNTGIIESTAATAVTLGSNAELTNSGSITSTGSVTVTLDSGATLVNTGTLSASGNTAVTASGDSNIDNGGTIEGNGDAIRLSGGNNTLTLRSGSEIQGDVLATSSGSRTDNLLLVDSGSASNAFLGFESLTLNGGTWSFSSTVEALNVSIGSGTLTVNGTLDTRANGTAGIIDLTAGTLSGTGTVLASVTNSAGFLAPGNPSGTLTISGDYTQTSTGTFRVTGSNAVGLLHVNGAAQLAGNLVVSAGSDLVADILIADGGISGFFDEVTVDGRALVAVVAEPNSIRLVRASTTLEDNMVEANLDNTYLALDTFAAPQNPAADSGLWVKGLGHYGERDKVGGLPGGDYLIGGVAGGGGLSVGDHFRIGAGIGYTHTDLDSDDGSDGDVDNVNYGVYVRYDNGTLHGGLTVSGVSGDYDQERRLIVNNGIQDVAASYDSTSYGIRGTLGSRHDFVGEYAGIWVLEPAIAVDYVVADLDPYVEQSSGLRYSIDDVESLQVSGLLHVRMHNRDTGIIPRFHVGVVHRVAVDDRTWAALGTAGGLDLELPGNDDDVTSFAAGAGFTFHLGPRIHGFTDWLGEFSDDKQRHALLAGLRIDL